MAVGDRLPEIAPTNQYSDVVVVDETPAQGLKQAARVRVGPTGASANQLQGNVAHDAVDAGNPVEIGGYAKATPPTDVSADADRVRAWFLRNGALAIYNAYGLDKADDAVTSWSPQSSTANTPSIASAATALAANSNRKSWRIQNLGQNPLFVRLGVGASTTVFHIVLNAGTNNDDGTGGILEDDSWVGLVSIAGTSPRYTATELT